MAKIVAKPKRGVMDAENPITIWFTIREYVEQNTDSLEAIWAGSTQGAPTRAAMRDSITALMGVVQQFRFATDEQRQAAAAQLDETRRALHRILAE